MAFVEIVIVKMSGVVSKIIPLSDNLNFPINVLPKVVYDKAISGAENKET